ncbi:hypothetical protein [Paenibacillus apiarius]|uniref:hypothetical protein n=1 Tax=Paenibacillus apiarius TaxID=46240 RepID=UPI00197E95CA|nr:hypothetical protein [Paenibacillus apiarius]MBN3526795.1 hypothetical protein [Paenibacillus apiarius]
MDVFDDCRSKDGRELPFTPAALSKECSICIPADVLHGLLQYEEKRNAEDAMYRILNTEEIIELRSIFQELECHQNICPLHDYPALSDDDEYSMQDNEAIAELDRLIMEEGLDEDFRLQLIFSKLTLMPCSRTEHLYEYLLSDDMYVQDKAVEIIRKRKYTAAAAQLFEVAKNGMHNGKVSAILALKELKTIESKQFLKELKTVLPASYLIYVQ